MKLRWQGRDIEIRQGVAKLLGDYWINEAKGEIRADSAASLSIVESCIGTWAWAFSLAEPVGGPSDRISLLTPALLSEIARDLMLNGEVCYEIAFSNDELSLVRCSAWDVKGRTANPRGWIFNITQNTPDGSIEKTLPADAVLFLTYSTKRNEPWQGSSPLKASPLTARIAATLEEKIRQEVNARTGYLIPVEDDVSNDKYTKLQGAIKNLKGGMTLVESIPNRSGEKTSNQWKQSRLGPEIQENMLTACDSFSNALASAYQVPLSLLGKGGNDGTSLREDFRRFGLTVRGLGNRIASGISEALDLSGLTISWQRLGAIDVAARGRALKQLVEAGIPIDEARAYLEL